MGVMGRRDMCKSCHQTPQNGERVWLLMSYFLVVLIQQSGKQVPLHHDSHMSSLARVATSDLRVSRLLAGIYSCVRHSCKYKAIDS